MSNNDKNNNPKFVTAALVTTGAIGVGVFLCMPAIASALVKVWGFSNDQVGQFSFVQLAFVSLGCLLGMFAGNRFSIRTLSIICLTVLAIMEFICPQFDVKDYSLFLAVRAVAGIAGGMAIALATGALAQLPGAERNFGLFLFVQICFSMVGILAIPHLISAIGIGGAFYPLSVAALLVLVFLTRYLPNTPVAALGADANQVSGQPRNTRAAWMYSWATLVAILAFFIAVGAFWTFVKLIGEQAGISPESTGLALSIAGFGGILGALVPIFLKTRLGSFTPLLVSFIVLLIAVYLIANHGSFITFTVAAMVFVFGWYVYNPYQMGVLASIDRDGRPAMASAALTGFGLGLGPALVQLYDGEGFVGVYVVSAISFSLAIVILAMVIVASRNMRMVDT